MSDISPGLLLILILLIIACAASVAWGIGWVIRHGVPVETTFDITIQTISWPLLVLRLACYVLFATLMMSAWLYMGTQIATLVVPPAAAFLKHGGTIATYKLHDYWNIRRTCACGGLLLGLLVGEAAFMLLRRALGNE